MHGQLKSDSISNGHWLAPRRETFIYFYQIRSVIKVLRFQIILPSGLVNKYVITCPLYYHPLLRS